MPQLTKVTSDVISTNTISGLISQGFTSVNVATVGTQTIEFGSSNTLVFRANTSAERMRITTGGFVGIGTNNPGSILSVYADLAPAITVAKAGDVGAGLQFGRDAASLNGFIILRENADLLIRTNNVERMRIANTGNVGIATTAPAQRLHIGLTGANNYIQFGTTNEGFVIGRENATGEFTFDATQASPYNVFRWRQSGTERMRIAADGNVGIGTTAPSQPLTVRTSGTSTSAGGNIGARIESNGSGYASTLQFSDNVANSSYISMLGSATIFGQAGTERMRISSGGNVGIGISNPSYTLDVEGTVRIGTGGSIQPILSRSGVSGGLIINTTAASAAGPLIVQDNGTERMRITSDGQVAIGSTSADPFSTVNTRMVGISSSGGGTTSALNITSGAGSRIQFGIGSTRTALIYSDSTNYTAISTETALPLLFQTNQTERMRIDSGGNVGVGVTPSAWRNAFGTKVIQFGPVSHVAGLSASATNNRTSVGCNFYINSSGQWIYMNSDYATEYQQTNGYHSFISAPQGTTGGIATGVETMRISPTGAIILQGGTTTASGVGITFPATQSASSDANTLDDYEEGTWTPIATSQTGSITSYVSNGSYIKIGRTVFIRSNITITNVGTAGGWLTVYGLPFTTASGERPFVALARENAATGNAFMAFAEASDTYFRISALTNVGAITWSTNYSYILTATYTSVN